jgi:hypothetical protein
MSLTTIICIFVIFDQFYIPWSHKRPFVGLLNVNKESMNEEQMNDYFLQDSID